MGGLRWVHVQGVLVASDYGAGHELISERNYQAHERFYHVRANGRSG
jgi:hypothetical protein